MNDQNDSLTSDRFLNAFTDLLAWCRAHGFTGHDPFDALNSSLFQKTPLAKSRNARLIWTQLIKRSPSDLRTIARVPRQRNSKGIALFALALLANYRRVKTLESEKAAREMLDALLSMKFDIDSGQNVCCGTAWGYNFDWQSRNFFAPQGTPTIVPTAFAVRALVDAAHTLGDPIYLKTAQEACHWIKSDLAVSWSTEDELCFSYSSLSSTQIYNASLLAAEALAEVGTIDKEVELLCLAERASRYVINRQQSDGSWTYGTEPAQSWIDNFHTAFILFSLSRIIKRCSLGPEFQQALERGYKYWKKNFFLADGWPKYYAEDMYPADAHAGASAIITFLELQSLDKNAAQLAEKVADWTIRNLRDEKGFFYYQRRRFYTVKTPYMRWSQAWMLYALARLLEDRGGQSQETITTS
ncbi:MAG: hypothetical protein C5B55_08010 [Blastocatellia bacterium]|nr:MAG: hypothetical protein C5B55_08010 [Blastocatellia bacterium]